jgi:hypothetical protein
MRARPRKGHGDRPPRLQAPRNLSSRAPITLTIERRLLESERHTPELRRVLARISHSAEPSCISVRDTNPRPGSEEPVFRFNPVAELGMKNLSGPHPEGHVEESTSSRKSRLPSSSERSRSTLPKEERSQPPWRLFGYSRPDCEPPFPGVPSPMTYLDADSHWHRAYLTQLKCAFRFSQPLDALLHPHPLGLVSCRSRLWGSALRGFPLLVAATAFAAPCP